MSIITTDSQNYTNIANAIRSKVGTSDTFKPSEMASAILDIPSGSGTDVSDTTAIASDVKFGKIFHMADGTKTTGTVDLRWGVLRPDAEKVTTLTKDVKWVEDLELTIPAYTTTSTTLLAASDMTPTVTLTTLDSYDYFVLERALTIPEYASGTGYGKGREDYQFCSALYEIVNFPAKTFVSLNGTKSYGTRITTVYSGGNCVRLLYWSSGTAVTCYASAAYGCTTTMTAPVVSSTSAASPTLTVKFPAIVIRGHATYYSSTYMNATTDVRTQFITDVYRIPKSTAWGINGWGMKSQAMHILDCIDTTNHTLT